MRSLNRVELIGNLGADPDVRATQSGKTIVNLSIATSEQWTDKTTGNREEKTEWHRVVFFDKPAEVIAEYCKKGSRLYVEGRLQTRSWDDQATGQKKYATEIVGQNFLLLDGGRQAENGGGSNGRQASSGRPAAAPQQQNAGGYDLDFLGQPNGQKKDGLPF